MPDVNAVVPAVKPSKPVRAQIGLAWYRREDYPRILEMMADRNDMHDTYDEWLREVERAEQHLASEGYAMVHVVIDPDDFRAWCDQRNQKPTAKARSRFVAEATGAMNKDGGRQP